MKRIFTLLLPAAMLLTTTVVEAKRVVTPPDPISVKGFDAAKKDGRLDRNNNGVYEVDLVAEYGFVSGAKEDQSQKLQRAICETSQRGGGELFIPTGDYTIGSIVMRSNVHIIVEGSTYLTLAPNEARTPKMFIFSPTNFEEDDQGEDSFIENCALYGLRGELYTADYRSFKTDNNVGAQRVQFATMGRVRNFILSDFVVLNSRTTFSAIGLGAANAKGAEKWEVCRPTDGIIRHGYIYNAHPGYGLTQVQSSERVHFENIFSEGGVTLRLETGAAGINGGNFDLTAKDIYGYRCNTVVLISPHSTYNGRFDIDGVNATSCGLAVTIKPGYVDPRHDYVKGPGYYVDGSTISNIHAKYGENCLYDFKNLWLLNPEKYCQVDYHLDRGWKPVPSGPSIGVVYDATYKAVEYKGELNLRSFKIDISNASYEGDYPDYVKGRDGNCVMYYDDPAIPHRESDNEAIYEKVKIGAYKR